MYAKSFFLKKLKKVIGNKKEVSNKKKIESEK